MNITSKKAPSKYRWTFSLLAAIVLAVATGTLSGCNTVAGAGQDVSAAGNAVTKAADKVKGN